MNKEIDQYNYFLATEYLRGNISFEELVQDIGKEDAEVVKLGIEKVK